MNSSFNERNFDDTTNQIINNLMKTKKNNLDKITINDFENTVNNMLNDEQLLKQITREDIIENTTLVKNEVNKNNFGLTYLKSRIKLIKDQNKMFSFVQDKNKKKNNPFRGFTFNFVVKKLSSSVFKLSKDFVLFFFTICIVAHLRMRTFIKSCYLYPSNPNRFPYVFYDKDKKEQKKILSITNYQTDVLVEPVFQNIKTFNSNDKDSLEKKLKINDMCGDDENGNTKEETNMLEIAAKLLLGTPNDDGDEFASKIENAIKQINGSTYADKIEKINISSKTFMEEHYEKCPDELSIYSLVTYLMYYNTLKNRDSIGYLHNSLFKYLTSSSSKLKFGVMSILLYSLFKNNVNISERFVNKVLDNYSYKYKSGGKMHSIFTGILSCFLAPFVTFLLMLMIIMYPLSLYNCLKSYINYFGFSNQISTRAVCLFGSIYSLFALAFYFMGLMIVLFPEFLEYMAKELGYKSPSSRGSQSSNKPKSNNKRKSKKKKSKKKKSKKRKSNKRKSNKRKSSKRKSNKRKKKKRKKKRGKEGFNGEKGCSASGFFSNFNMAKLFGLILLSILGLIIFMPIVIPFVCAAMSSFGIASSLTFDALKFMSDSLCFVKKYSGLIKILVSMIMLHKIFNLISYGPRKRRSRMFKIGLYIAVLVIYLGIETLIKPTDNYFKDNCENNK